MKKWILSAPVLCAILLAHNASAESGFYLKADAGGQWTRDTSLREFFGEPLPDGSRVKFHPGVRLGITAGYQVCDWFAGELETGVMANEIRFIEGATRGDATLSQVPLLLNARLQLPTQSRFSPYVGGGVGMSSAVIDTDRLQVGDTRMNGADADAVFAYQAFGGIRYRLNDQMGLGLEYRYFAACAPSWRADLTFGTSTDRLRFGRATTHAISFTFDYRF